MISQDWANQEALEQRYQMLVENASDIIYTHDLLGNFTSVNQAAERLTGYSRAEALKMNIAQVVAPEYLETVRNNLLHHNQGRVTPTYELEIVTKSGGRRVMDVNTQLIIHDGQLVGVQGIARDMTERKQAEQALRQSEARLLLSQRIGKLGSWELDLTTQSLTWSEELYHIFGRQPGAYQPTREAFYAAIHPADRGRVRAAVDKALTTRGHYEVDHRILLPDGSQRIVHEQAEVVEAGGRIMLVGTAQDITERKRLEEQLLHAQKMEAVGQLAGGVAHDFNNMLMIIQGNLAMLLAEATLTERFRESLLEVLSAAARAGGLTQQLLAFSRRQVLQVRQLDVDELLSTVAKLLYPLLGETIRMELQLSVPSVVIEGDAGKIEQVIMNLAVNARDAMPKGGKMTLGTEHANLAAEDAQRNPEARPGKFVVITVTDTGSGMDTATLARIFEPFFTTKEVGKGTGLGLSTAYGIVKQHQGWMEVQSVLGEGTTFRIYLPASDKIPEKTPPVISPSTSGGGHETILVVEDEPSLRALVGVVLKRYGYHVLEARNGVEALEIWTRHRDQIDLLLTDMVMPEGISGRELVQRLQKDNTVLPVIYTSGYSADWFSSELPLREGVNFLQKPYHPAKLAQIVRENLNKAH